MVDRLGTHLGKRAPRWTAGARLPGGDLPAGSFAVFARAMERRYPWLPAPVRRRYARAYGTRMQALIEPAGAIADLGAEVLPGLYERELEYLCREEWARTAVDILWRRSKLGLHVPPASAGTLDEWLARHCIEPPRRAALPPASRRA